MTQPLSSISEQYRSARRDRAEKALARQRALEAQLLINHFTPKLHQARSQARNYTIFGFSLVFLFVCIILFHPFWGLLSLVGAILCFRKAHKDRETVEMAEHDLFIQQAIVDAYNGSQGL